MGMKVLVTGATGRVGANVVKQLTSCDMDVKAMVMPGDPHADKLGSLPNARIVEADLRDQDAIDVACRDVTHVVHLAAQMGRGHSTVDQYWDVNAFGTLRMLEGVVHARHEIERFVLISSDGTYRPGAPPAVPLTEDQPQEPADYYGTGKLLGEVILRNHGAQFDIPWSIVRFGTVVSPEEAVKMFRVSFIRAILGWQKLGRESHIWQLFHGQPDLLTIFDASIGDAPDESAVSLTGPDGSPWTLHMVDVRDAAQGVYRALTEPRAIARAFNIASAHPTSYTDGASVVSETFDVPQLAVEMPLTWRLELSIKAAQESIRYQPKYDYGAMVQSAIATEVPANDEFIPAVTGTGISSVL